MAEPPPSPGSPPEFVQLAEYQRMRLQLLLSTLKAEEQYARSQILGASTAVARRHYANVQASLRVDVQSVRRLLRRHDARVSAELEIRGTP